MIHCIGFPQNGCDRVALHRRPESSVPVFCDKCFIAYLLDQKLSLESVVWSVRQELRGQVSPTTQTCELVRLNADTIRAIHEAKTPAMDTIHQKNASHG